MTMGAGTTRLGLGATYSTTYYEPFHVARALPDARPDDRRARGLERGHVDERRRGPEHGPGEPSAHDPRYDRADEFMEVVPGHWDTWADDALIVDRESAAFSAHDKGGRLDHKGEHLRSRRPFTVPRTPQGHPVIIQAGQSGRGRRFAGRWAQVIFAGGGPAPGPAGRLQGREGRDRRRRAPTNPDQVDALHPRPDTVCAATKAEAEDKMAYIEKLPLEIDALSLLSEAPARSGHAHVPGAGGAT